MSTYEPNDDRSAADGRQPHVVVIAQLLKAVQTMYSIDEFFQWLGYALVQQFDMQVVQFWTPFVDANGNLSSHLRMMARKDPSIPDQVVLNEQVSMVVKGIESEQRVVPARPVENFFSPYQASLLKRYDLHFCASNSIRSDVLLPPPGNHIASAASLLPFSLTTLFFIAQRSHWNVMPAINTLLKEAVTLATNRSLLLTPIPQNPLPQQAFPEALPPSRNTTTPFSAIIPHRRESNSLMLTDNPFSRDSAIKDKQANRLYTLIDGKKSIVELSRKTGMDMKDLSAALQTLLKLNRVALCDPQGQPIKPLLFFPESDL